jgi:hypothetical protein
MNRVNSLIVTLTVLLALTPCGWAQSPAPKLVLSQPNWDFGQAWHEDQPTMTLIIRNEGNAELKMTEVRSTCGCTIAQPKEKVVAPGGSTDVQVTYNTYGKQGEVTSKVIIESNDPQRPTVDFDIKGFVKRAITRTPLGGLGMRSLTGKPGMQGSLRLENQMQTPMSPKLVANSMSTVDVEIKEVTPGLVYDVVARTNTAFPVGQHRGTITLSTGLEREPRMSIPVTVKVLRIVEPIPAAIYLRKGDSKPALSRIVKLHYHGTGTFEVTGTECTNPAVKIDITKTLPPMEWMQTKMDPPVNAYVQATLTLPPPDQVPDEGIVVNFLTNLPDQPKVEVVITTDQNRFNEIMHGK